MKKKNFKITILSLLAILLSTQILLAQSWLKTGNPSILTTNYVGPQNDVPLNFKIGGQGAGKISSTGLNSFGYRSGNNTQSTAFGSEALFASASNNTAVGNKALTAGGSQNVAIGSNAILSGTSNNQTAIGYESMVMNTNGYQNTGVGMQALVYNTTGQYNSACGARSGGPSWGSYNASIGAYSLEGNGNDNTAAGALTFLNTTNLSECTALGYFAAISVPGSTNHAVVIGNSALVNANTKVRLGNSTVTAIEGQVAYTYPSDGRFKTNITEEVQGLNFITRLRPVVYNFDTRKFDEFLTQNMPDSIRNARLAVMDYAPSTAIRQTGFIAQEVEKTAKEIGYDFNGVHAPVDANDNYSIAYSQFVMPLVKSVQELNATNIALQARLDAQEALIQKLLATKGDADATKQNAASVDAPLLGQNAPNPTDGETTIQYYVPESMACNTGKCLIALHDLNGRRIQTVAVSAGHGSINLQLNNLADGIYSYQLIVNDAVVATHKLVVSK